MEGNYTANICDVIRVKSAIILVMKPERLVWPDPFIGEGGENAMKKRILEYLNKVKKILASEAPTTNWDEVLAEHLNQIGFFQHERLIHLIVTVTVALLLLMTLLLMVLIPEVDILLLVFFIILAVMLFLYIIHYYILETTVQKLYGQYDEILQKRNMGKRL